MTEVEMARFIRFSGSLDALHAWVKTHEKNYMLVYKSKGGKDMFAATMMLREIVLTDDERAEVKRIQDEFMHTQVRIMKVNASLPGHPSMHDHLNKAVVEENYELAALIHAEIERDRKEAKG